MKFLSAPLMESLESRTLFSEISPVAAISLAPPSSRTGALSSSPGTTVSGVTLQLTADVPYTGSVGFVSSSSIATLQPRVSINWGDGTSSTGTLQPTILNGVSGYNIIGTHTYTLAGTDAISTTITLAPISVPGHPTPQFILLLPQVDSTAIVATPAVNSSGGVTLNVVTGQSFAADVGAFSTIAPADHIAAMIHWGDGTATPAKLTAAGVSGIDVLNFDAAGHHRYAKPGTYHVRVNVTEPSIGVAGKRRVITTLLSTVIVASR